MVLLIEINQQYKFMVENVNLFQRLKCSSVVACLFLVLLPKPGLAVVDNWKVEGANGALFMSGILTDGICSLDMESQFQEISLGTLTNAAFKNVGDEGEPVLFKIKLSNCYQNKSSHLNLQTGNVAWGADQPTISVSFFSSRSESDGQHVNVDGASGIALKILDEKFNQITLSVPNKPSYIDVGKNELVFYVVPQRIGKRLVLGDLTSTVDFQLNYN